MVTWTMGLTFKSTAENGSLRHCSLVSSNMAGAGSFQFRCTIPKTTVAGTCAPRPSPGQPAWIWWQEKTGRACQSWQCGRILWNQFPASASWPCSRHPYRHQGTLRHPYRHQGTLSKLSLSSYSRVHTELKGTLSLPLLIVS